MKARSARAAKAPLAALQQRPQSKFPARRIPEQGGRKCAPSAGKRQVLHQLHLQLLQAIQVKSWRV